MPLIHNSQVYFVQRNQDKRQSFSGILTTYNLFNNRKPIAKNFDFDVCKRYFCPKMLMILNKLTLLVGDHEVETKKLKLSLYQTNNKGTSCSWDHLISWNVSATLIQLSNTLCASYENDGIAIVSIPVCNRMNIFILSPVKSGNKNWKSAFIRFPDLLPESEKIQIQSCVTISNYMYCYSSLLIQEKEAYVYKINLTLLKQHKETHDRPLPYCKLDTLASPKINSCFLSTLYEKIFFITSEHMDNDTTLLKVEQFDHCANADHDTVPLPTLGHHDQWLISSRVTVVAASIVFGIHNTVVVIYHDSNFKKCFIALIKL